MEKGRKGGDSIRSQTDPRYLIVDWRDDVGMERGEEHNSHQALKAQWTYTGKTNPYNILL